jgi:hypothetical protein
MRTKGRRFGHLSRISPDHAATPATNARDFVMLDKIMPKNATDTSVEKELDRRHPLYYRSLTPRLFST